MPKLSFKVPENVPEVAPQEDKQIIHMGLAGAVGVVAIVSLVLLFTNNLPTAAVIEATCAGSGTVVDDPSFVDILERRGHECDQTGVPGIWCCNRRT